VDPAAACAPIHSETSDTASMAKPSGRSSRNQNSSAAAVAATAGDSGRPSSGQPAGSHAGRDSRMATATKIIGTPTKWVATLRRSRW